MIRQKNAGESDWHSGTEKHAEKLPDFAEAIEKSDENQLWEILKHVQLNPENFYVCVSVGESNRVCLELDMKRMRLP